tara:strand:- start:1091 stop:1300 length:210 start_codon:yes stop_codon:yes gene_type:complete
VPAKKHLLLTLQRTSLKKRQRLMQQKVLPSTSQLKNPRKKMMKRPRMRPRRTLKNRKLKRQKRRKSKSK